MNSIHKRCNIEVDECPVTQADNDETYAYKRRSFIISTNREHAADAPLYKVNKIDFLPAPRIAILDNDGDILELLKKIASRYGIETETFQTADAMLAALEQQSFEAFILDWLLDFGETSERVVKKLKTFSIRTPALLF